MLTNVLRHARATCVEIVMAHDGHEFVLEVRDNGCGITGAELADTKSLGLLGMRERIQLIDGKIEISGVKGKGTKVVVSVPLR
jgi:signal transduction histidine kinase